MGIVCEDVTGGGRRLREQGQLNPGQPIHFHVGEGTVHFFNAIFFMVLSEYAEFRFHTIVGKANAV